MQAATSGDGAVVRAIIVAVVVVALSVGFDSSGTVRGLRFRLPWTLLGPTGDRLEGVSDH